MVPVLEMRHLEVGELVACALGIIVELMGCQLASVDDLLALNRS